MPGYFAGGSPVSGIPGQWPTELKAPTPLSVCVAEQQAGDTPLDHFSMCEISDILSCKSRTGPQGFAYLPSIASSEECSQLLSFSVPKCVHSATDLSALDSEDRCEDRFDDTSSPELFGADGPECSAPGACVTCTPPPRDEAQAGRKASVNMARVSELGAELDLLRLSPAFSLSAYVDGRDGR